MRNAWKYLSEGIAHSKQEIKTSINTTTTIITIVIIIFAQIKSFLFSIEKWGKKYRVWLVSFIKAASVVGGYVWPSSCNSREIPVREKKLKCGVAEKKKQRPTTPTLEALYHYIKGAFWFRLYPKLESTTSDYDDNIWHMGGLHDPLESKSGQNGILRYFPGLLERNVLISSYLRILLLNESRTAPRSRKSILVNCMNCFRPLGDYWASSSGRATHAPESVCLFIRGLEHRKERTEFWVQAQWWALGRYYRTARRMEVY